MYCGKCGAEIPEGSAFCSSCGAPVSSKAVKSTERQQLDMLSERIKADPAGALTVLGSLLVIIGAFLPWTYDTLGVMMTAGAVVCTLAVLDLAVLILGRSGAAGAWNVVMLLLSALALALIFQSLYFLNDWDADIGAGLWVAMAGVIVVTLGSFLEQGVSRKV